MLEDIYEMMPSRQFNALVNISFKDRYVYFKTPKVASSTIGLTLSKHESRTLPKAKTPAHPIVEQSVFIKPYQLPEDMLKDILWGGDYCRFTMVRNPYARLVSAYKDKILNNEAPKAQILSRLAGMGVITREEDDFERNISFEQFVEAITRTNPKNLDIHWKPQAILTCARWLKHDFVGRMENFEADIVALQDMIGVPVKDKMITHVPHKTNASSTWQGHFDESLAARVAAYYAEDFKLFGYDPESWRG